MEEEKNRGGAHRGSIRGVRAPTRCKLRGEVRAPAQEEGDAGVVLVLVMVDDEDAIDGTSAAVEDPVLASLPSMVWGT
jgi:hypothetical protein